MHACRPHLHPPSLPSGGLLASTAQHLLEPDAPAAMRDADRICSQAGSGTRARGGKRVRARRKMQAEGRARAGACWACALPGRLRSTSPVPPRTEAARPRTRGLRHLVHVGPDGRRQGGKPRHKLHRAGGAGLPGMFNTPGLNVQNRIPLIFFPHHSQGAAMPCWRPWQVSIAGGGEQRPGRCCHFAAAVAACRGWRHGTGTRRYSVPWSQK